jgi:ATP-dependent RNA helicase DeaD
MTLPSLPAALPQALAETLAARGYASLTPVQEEMLRPDLAGRDMIVSARTGSGKTVAFGVALAERVLPVLRVPGPPKALIIAPTRELAMQVRREFEWLYGPAGGLIASCVGGMDMRREIFTLEKGAQIVVGTPGRLVDHLKRGSLNLSGIVGVVLDEADEMLDLGFAEDLAALLSAAPDDKQTLMFSATVPKAIEKLAAGQLRPGFERVSVAGGEEQHADITYDVAGVPHDDAERALVNILRFHESERAIIFANTRAAVARIAARLGNRGFRAVALSGELSQSERTHALQALRDGRARVCVATDVAARGIDLKGLDLVIHAELPGSPETLKHRSGRTGRAGRKGTSVLVVTPRTRAKADRMAGIDANWGSAPTAEDVRARDAERLVEAVGGAVELEEDDRGLAARIAADCDPVALAATVVSFWRASNSAPEEIGSLNTAPPPREKRAVQDFGASVWVRLSKGRRERAEARWILPKICQAGGITREEIGAIRVGEAASFVQIAERAAGGFMLALGPDGVIEDGLYATKLDGAPDPAEYAYTPPNSKGPKKPHRGQRDGDERPAPRYGREDKSVARAPRDAKPAKTETWDDKPILEAYRGERSEPKAPKPRAEAEARPKSKKEFVAKSYAAKSHTAKDRSETDAPKAPYKAGPKPSSKWTDKPGAGTAKLSGKPSGKPGGKPGAKPDGKPWEKPKGPKSAGFKAHGGKGKPAKAQGFKSHSAPGAKGPSTKGPDARPTRKS